MSGKRKAELTEKEGKTKVDTSEVKKKTDTSIDKS